MVANAPHATQPLLGQKALVTGASSGIGRAVAIALGRAGADVIVNYASSAREADETVAQIRGCGRRALAYKADVSSEAEVEGMFRHMQSELGTVDILIANAGLQQDARVEDMTLAQWNKVLSINLTGQFLCARGRTRVSQARRGCGNFACRWQDHLYEFGASSHTLGGSLQLCSLQGGCAFADAEPGAGAGAGTHPRQCHRAGRH